MLDYQSIVDTLTAFIGISCPLVIVCGLSSRLFNAFVGMVTGKERVRF